MPKITDAQVDVAEGAYWAVITSHDYQDGPASMKAMRAALEAYERVRDVERILSSDAVLSPDAVNVGLKLTAKAAAAGYPVARELHEQLENVHQKIRKEYPL